MTSLPEMVMVRIGALLLALVLAQYMAWNVRQLDSRLLAQFAAAARVAEGRP